MAEDWEQKHLDKAVAQDTTPPPQGWVESLTGGYVTPGMLQRMGIETAGAVAGWNQGQRMMRQLPPHPASRLAQIAVPAAMGAVGAFTGKNVDQRVLKNVQPGDEGIMSDILASAGGTIGTLAPDLAAGATRKIFSGSAQRAAAQRSVDRNIRFTPGTTSDSKLVQALEQRLRELPLTGDKIESAYGTMYKQFQDAVKVLVDDDTLDLSTDAFVQGQRVQQSAARKMDAFHNRANALYKLVRMGISKNTPVPLDSTRKFLDSYAGEYGPGMEQMQKVMGDKFMERIRRALGDAEGLSWGDIDQIRKQVGMKTRGAVTPEMNPAIAKNLYKAILDDMEVVAKRLSSPGGGPVKPGVDNVYQAFRNARRYWRQGQKALDETYEAVEKANPEQLFKAIESGSVTKIAQARKASDPATWRHVQAAVVQRMGLVTAGRQDAAGLVFSPRTFLTGYNKFRMNSPRAYKLMFGEAGNYKGISKDLDDLAVIAQNMSRPGAQQSSGAGTANALALLGVAPAMMYDPMMTGAVIAGAKGSSSLWTSPRFLSWLTSGKNASPGTRAFGNWVSSMPTFYMIHNLQESDEVALELLKEGLDQLATNDIPSTPDYNPARDRLRERLAPGSLMGQVPPQV